MRTATKRALILSLMLAASPAAAQSVSDQGARDLAASFAAYIGQPAIDSRIVTVEAGAKAYTVTIDLPKIVAGANPDKAEITVEPLSFEAVPKSDGTWTITADSMPSLKVVQQNGGSEETFEFAARNYSFEGVFDPKLAAFVSGEAKVDKVTLSSHGPEGDIEAEQGATTVTLEAAAAGDGAVTSKIRQVSASLIETITIKADESEGTKVEIKAGETSLDIDLDSARQKNFLEIVAFFAANPSQDKMVAAQADLRSRLVAALPLWKGVSGNFLAKDVAIDTLMGTFKVATVTQNIGMSGLAKDGYYDVGWKFTGLEVPAALVPTWAKAVLPSEMDFAARLSGPDLEAASRLAVEHLDLSDKGPWPADLLARLFADVRNGPLKLTIKPGGASSPSLTLAVAGEATILPEPIQAAATVTADGIDKAMADMQASNDQDPEKQQALMMLGMAKALAKPGDGGKSVWKIEMLKDGSVNVNGQQLQPPSEPTQQ